ncbi:hypothetical protein BVX98_07705 [bacterium F11]|nr:hypothetical protein BVX98_07705 [bacterium F11]
MRNEKGSLLILSMPILVFLFGMSLLILDLARGHYEIQSLQMVADATLLSSLRMRVQGGSRVVERWSQFGDLFLEGMAEGAVVDFEMKQELIDAARDLKRSLSGYKGRIKAIIKVVAEANRKERTDVQLDKEEASQLGLVPRDVTIVSPSGDQGIVPHGWVQRTWSPLERMAEPQDISVYRVSSILSLLIKGKKWLLHQKAAGRLRWDVDRSDPTLLMTGNGGFPRTWAEALEENKVKPYRYPYFRVELVDGE